MGGHELPARAAAVEGVQSGVILAPGADAECGSRRAARCATSRQRRYVFDVDALCTTSSVLARALTSCRTGACIPRSMRSDGIAEIVLAWRSRLSSGNVRSSDDSNLEVSCLLAWAVSGAAPQHHHPERHACESIAISAGEARVGGLHSVHRKAPTKGDKAWRERPRRDAQRRTPGRRGV